VGGKGKKERGGGEEKNEIEGGRICRDIQEK